jgi:hypothetical protein
MRTHVWGGGLADQFTATVSKVKVECDDVLQITPDTVSYVYGANDTTGIPTVFATNKTTLLNGAEARFGGVQPWTVMAVGAALSYFTL